MNTAIQDAANLGWRVARLRPGGSVGRGVARLLRQEERRPVARQVLALTHLAFLGEASIGRLPSMLRSLSPLAAPVVPVLMGRRRLVAAGYRRLSQLDVNYRSSPLSTEGKPGPRPWPRARPSRRK